MSDKDSAPDGAPDPHLAAEADAILAEFGEAGVTATPTGEADQAAAATDIPTGKLCGDLLDVTFNGLIAPKRGDHWQLSGEESAALGDAYGAVIDKYFPNLSGGPEVLAVVLTMAIIGPRLAKDVTAKPAKKAAGKADQSKADTAGEYTTSADDA